MTKISEYIKWIQKIKDNETDLDVERLIITNDECILVIDEKAYTVNDFDKIKEE